MQPVIFDHMKIVALAFADADITQHLDLMVKTACPELYGDLHKAYEAGRRWAGMTLPAPDTGVEDTFKRSPVGGPFLGRVSIWKLQVGVHRDAKDFLCAIINGGDYDGGGAVFPDIGLKVR